MTTNSDAGFRDIRVTWADLASWIARRWAWIPITVVIVLGLVVVITARHTPIYVAHGVVQLALDKSGDSAATGSAIDQLHSKMTEEGREARLEFARNGLTHVIGRGATPEEALGNANRLTALAVEITQKSLDKERADRVAKIDETKKRHDEANALVGRMDQALSASLYGPPEDDARWELSQMALIFQKREDITHLAFNLRDRYEGMILNMSASLVDAEVIAEPAVDERPVRPAWRRNLGLGTFLGLAIGLILVLLLGLKDKMSVRSAE